jgi:hypothetical protein
MTCQTETPCSATLTSSPSPDKRVRYGLGMLLGVADFEQEQAWFLGQDREHVRTLHGCGVVGGLGVAVTDARLKVDAGLAIDGLGRVINVCGEQCADLNAWLQVAENRKRIGAPGAKTLHVVLRYCECATDLQPVPGQPCRTAEESMSATRITASFSLDLETTAPACPEEAATVRFGQWLRRLHVGSGNPTLDAAAIEADLKAMATTDDPATTALYLPADQAESLLRHALAVWARVVRPLVCYHGEAINDDEIGVPLASLGFTLTDNFTASDVKLLPTDPPVLASTRLIQEALLNLTRQITAGNTVQPLAFGGAAVPGSDTAYSRADHVHYLPPLPEIPGPGATVKALSFGGVGEAGTLATFSRSDHVHPLPALPAIPPIPDLSGDVAGAIGDNRITMLQGKVVKADAPGKDQVLTFRDDVWQPLDVPTGGGTAPTDVVLHPAGLPAYSLVAAGVMASGRSFGPTYNTLEAKAAGDGLLFLTFAGYKRPIANSRFVLLVKALPMVHKEFAALSVSLQGFQAEGFVLQILSNGKPVPEGVLDQVFIHVEVSHFTT